MGVKVCDAICGAGKTQSCINMINNSENQKFMFVTPYLSEVERIKKSCAIKDFVSPEFNGVGSSKLKDVERLIRAGKNIVTTHALFSNYTEETKACIREQNYTLILDEEINLFQAVDLDTGDVDFLIQHNVVEKNEDIVSWIDKEYDGIVFDNVKKLAKSRNMVDYDGTFYFWSLPIDVFQSFSDAYVLTYLFDYQPMKYYFVANGIQYEIIGTKKQNGIYQFCPLKEMDRRIDLRKKIHIFENGKFNKIGEGSYSLSAAWFDRATNDPNDTKIDELKSNLRRFLRRSKEGSRDRMWTCLNRHRKKLRGKGYADGFVTYNQRATNDFAEKHYLAFCLNVYMMPWIKNYLARIGHERVNQGMYALSILIQWIFRSAIRKGEEVWIYLPSKRMRRLLKEWLNNLASGNDLKEITLKSESAKDAKTVEEIRGRLTELRLHENNKEEKQ